MQPIYNRVKIGCRRRVRFPPTLLPFFDRQERSPILLREFRLQHFQFSADRRHIRNFNHTNVHSTTLALCILPGLAHALGQVFAELIHCLFRLSSE